MTSSTSDSVEKHVIFPQFRLLKTADDARALSHIAVMLRVSMVLAVSLLSVLTATGAEICANDELWIISTRQLTSDACRAPLDAPDFKVMKLYENCQSEPASFAELAASIAAEPNSQTVVYVHGNRFTHCDAIERANFVYRKMVPHRCTGQPIRLILFSWPSEQEGVLLNDVRVKAERTDAQGLYLAWCIREINAQTASLTLIGYSFGGRVVTGALHALAGGTLGGRRLTGEQLSGVNARVALIAAAIDRDWLEPQQYHGRATLNMERMTLMYNPRDTVLKKYWLLDPATISRALGAVGPMRFNRRVDGTPLPVKSINCSRTVGREHDELDYFSAECRAGKHLAELIENR